MYAISRTFSSPYPGADRSKKNAVVLWYRRPEFDGDTDNWLNTPKGGVQQLIREKQITTWHNKPSAEAEMPPDLTTKQAMLDAQPRGMRGIENPVGPPTITEV